MLVFLLCLFSLAYCQKALCQLPLLRTALTRNLHSKGTGFDAYCPFLTNLKDCFFFFLWLLECKEVCVLSGDYFFMMLPMMFLLCTYFSILPACFKAGINCYEYYRRSRKSRSTAIRKMDFLNVEFTFDFIP